MTERKPLNISVPECAPDEFCDPLTEHTDTHIRNVCLRCGKIGPWIEVIAQMTKGNDDA